MESSIRFATPMVVGPFKAATLMVTSSFAADVPHPVRAPATIPSTITRISTSAMVETNFFDFLLIDIVSNYLLFLISD